MKLRVQLWPLWAAVLGLWFPLDFFAAVDGYYHILRPQQFPFVYAAAWTEHAVPMLLLTLGSAIGAWLVLRTPRLVTAGLWLVTTVARTVVGMSLVYLLLDWLQSVVPAAPIPPLSSTMALLIALAAAALTWRNPAPGRLLQLSRRIAIGSAVAVMILLPLEAVLNAIETRHAPHAAQLKAGDKPDVVLITIDTLAANHMSVYGYERDTTPRLAEFAKQATLFERFYANSNFTSPTSASFLYGVRSWATRAWNVGSPPVDPVYGHHLLQAFHDAGYRVLTVDTNPCAAPMQNRLLPWVDERRSLATRTAFLWSYWPDAWLPSFDVAFVSAPLRWLQTYIDKVLVKLGVFSQNGHFDPELALGDARELWTRNAGAPRLLWVHLFGPHDPYAAPPEYLGRFDPSADHRTRFNSSPIYQWGGARNPAFPGNLIGRYDEGVLYFDQHVGGFLDWLKQDGSFESAIVVISADHGESFSHHYGGHGGPLLSEDLIHIPLLVKAPQQQAPRRNEVVAEQVDLPQILLQLAGLPLLSGVEGRALAPEAGPDDDPAFAMNFERNRRFDALTTGTVAMVQGTWKYVHYQNLKPYLHMPPMPDELYDLRNDPKETTNLIDREPQRATQMQAAIAAELARHDGPVP